MESVRRFFRWLIGLSISPPTDDFERIVNQTNRFNMTLFIIGLFAIIALILAGALSDGGIKFTIWALIAAFGSATFGGALGVLFGLPTSEAKRAALNAMQVSSAAKPVVTGPKQGAGEAIVAQPAPGTVMQVQEDLDTGYRDSTSLEQIADWLTKIIVGLTLTQFASWSKRFEIMASNLTDAMMGPVPRSADCATLVNGARGSNLLDVLDLPVCHASPIPGGSIIALFAFGGFLTSYLWMRRYFILEMVMAKRQAIDLLKRERQSAEKERRKVEEQNVIKAAREAALAESSPMRSLIDYSQLDEILGRAESRVPPKSAARAALGTIRKRITQGTTDPDDPWRGKFGGASAAGVQLDATVSPMGDSPQFFKVDLLVRAQDPARASKLQGTKVLYFLHPTFGDQPRISYFTAERKAPLELYAYGAFTVGALLDDGTMLELNLATIPGAPAHFVAQ